jgi:hypothetical protein
LIANALRAAPASVARHAAVVVMEANGTMRTLRKGTNGFTCVPNTPGLPGSDAM